MSNMWIYTPDGFYSSRQDEWCEEECWINVMIAEGATEAAAWRKAVRRLERLLKEAKKKAGTE